MKNFMCFELAKNSGMFDLKKVWLELEKYFFRHWIKKDRLDLSNLQTNLLI